MEKSLKFHQGQASFARIRKLTRASRKNSKLISMAPRCWNVSFGHDARPVGVGTPGIMSNRLVDQDSVSVKSEEHPVCCIRLPHGFSDRHHTPSGGCDRHRDYCVFNVSIDIRTVCVPLHVPDLASPWGNPFRSVPIFHPVGSSVVDHQPLRRCSNSIPLGSRQPGWKESLGRGGQVQEG